LIISRPVESWHQTRGITMTPEEYEAMPVKPPIEANAIDAIHIDSPASPAECDKCEACKKPEYLYWGQKIGSGSGG